MKGLLKPTSAFRTSAALLFASSVTTGRNVGSSSCGLITNIFAVCLSGTSRSISLRWERATEQRQLSSRVQRCFWEASLIMRQKRRKPQQETTVHKDMAREELVRQYSPEVGRQLRQVLEQVKRERSGHE